MNPDEILRHFGLTEPLYGAGVGRESIPSSGTSLLQSRSPVDGRLLGTIHQAGPEEYEQVMKTALAAFVHWRRVPAPQRGLVVRRIVDRLRAHKDPLGRLVSWEMGKSLTEGWGEVQEMIDIGDLAVGLSRQLHGLTIVSERPDHRLMEQYHPLGPVAVITAFNFPVAVWAWNALIAAVCGDVVLWKPASQTPLSALAVQKIVAEVLAEENLPEGIFNLIIGPGSTIGERLISDPRAPLVSLTGSTRIGRHAAGVIGGRLGKYIMELGGNNAIILTEHADLGLAVPSIVFGAVGTAGQRCTSTRRLIVHESMFDRVRDALVRAYSSLRIGNPLDANNHIGPLIDQAAVRDFAKALDHVQSEGGRLLFGGKVLDGPGYESGCYVQPALVEAENHYTMVQEETFAPILYLIRYNGDVNQAVALQNGVPQGLSSAIFTTRMNEAEAFLCPWGSDCGLANVNLGTSGAEIGGAFGGEKETGGGREAGSDAWKAYMRRQTNTINYGSAMPLAQGVRFEL
jgi:aldehyde dehydrogenase (NAD+)